jgi:hypothetical protein
MSFRFFLHAPCSLPRSAGEGRGGGPRDMARRFAPRTPLPASPRKRGEGRMPESP